MNNVTPEKKESVVKTLAIMGLLGVIIFIAWLSVQIVNVFPTAITSLASLADSVYSYDPQAPKTINLIPVSEPVTSGKEVTVAWEQAVKKGAYTFSYECEEGLSIKIKTAESDFKYSECGSSYYLGAVDSAKLIINSEKKAEVDVRYTISYFKTNAASSTASNSQAITVINPRFAIGSSTVPSTEVTVNDQEITITVPVIVEPEEVVVVAPNEVPASPQATSPVYEYEYTYAIPTSNPKGFTDLAVTYNGIGKTTNSGTFINTGLLNKGADGAVQFSVKNIGTKTSADWYFTSKLPGEINYQSPKQTSLKPNERAVLTINFPAVTNNKLQTFSIAVKTEADINTKNNNVSWSVVVIE